MKLADLIKAYEAIEENKKEIPEEFSFLLTPEFKEKLKQVKDGADAIMLAAELLGEQIGEEEVTEEKVDELATAMKEEGFLPEKEEGEEEGNPEQYQYHVDEGEEEEAKEGEMPAREGESYQQEDKEPREVSGEKVVEEGEEEEDQKPEIMDEEPREVSGEKIAEEGKPAEIKPAMVDGKPTIDGDEAPIGEGRGGDAIEVPPEVVKERAMAAIGALLVKK